MSQYDEGKNIWVTQINQKRVAPQKDYENACSASRPKAQAM